MPERGSVERWFALGRLLPREVRERIFEPAMGDLLRNWLTKSDEEKGSFGAQAASTYFHCLLLGIPRLFIRGGRLTRLGRVSAWVTVTLVTVVLVLANMAQAYASFDR